MAIGFMKYDSSMKQFHDDIVHVIKKIIFPGKQRAKELSEEGSPAPLREFLKKGYGMNNLVGENFRCMSTSLIIEFKDRILNNEGANLLQLSWSQVATFIRNNSAEIFDDVDTVEKDDFPCNNCEHDNNGCCDYPDTPDDYCIMGDKQVPIEKNLKTYLDVLKEHYPNVDYDVVYTEYCPGNFFDGALDSQCDSGDSCEKCWSMPANEEWHDTAICVPDEWKATVASAVPVAEFPSCSCPLWKDNAFTNIGNRKPALSFSCNAYYSENVEDTNDFDKIERRCNDHMNCAHFLVHELTPLIKDKSIKINANTPLDELKHLYETFSSSSELTAAPEEPAAPATFDYAAIDADTADKLRQCENVIRQETSGYFTLLGAKFKEAQDILANHSSGTFEQWYRSMGFKRQTVYNLIQRYEFISSPTIGGHEETFENLPLTLSYEVSKPTAPAELVEKVLEGDITTHKEYIALKKELEDANKKIELAEQQSENFKRVVDANKANYEKYQEERERNAELEERDDALQRKNDALVIQNQELEQRVKELESRPVDVAVQSDEEAMSEKDEEIAELKALIDRLSDKDVKIFAIKLTLDEYETLLDLVSSSPLIKNAVSAAKILRI